MLNPLNFDLPISGMTCASCAGRVERALNKVPWVKTVSVNLANEQAHIETDGEPDTATLIAAVEKPDTPLLRIKTRLRKPTSSFAR